MKNETSMGTTSKDLFRVCFVVAGKHLKFLFSCHIMCFYSPETGNWPLRACGDSNFYTPSAVKDNKTLFSKSPPELWGNERAPCCCNKTLIAACTKSKTYIFNQWQIIVNPGKHTLTPSKKKKKKSLAGVSKDQSDRQAIFFTTLSMSWSLSGTGTMTNFIIFLNMFIFTRLAFPLW